MLFEQRLWVALADGSVTVTFRRAGGGRGPGREGGTLTPAGVLAVDAVAEVDPAAITEDDARRAGLVDLAALLRQPGPARRRPVYRVDFHHAGAYPRRALREADDLAEEDLAGLRARLERLDRAARDGPWTVATLELIGDRPGARAADLAAAAGRERRPFKADVRKLKELGLTESLEVGYRLSPRGWALLGWVGPPRARE